MPVKWSIMKQSWTIIVIVGASSMVNPETAMKNNGDCWHQFNGQSWKLWRDNGDMRLQEILHTKRWCQTVVCLPHMMISRSDMPTTYDDLMQWYAYHIQCYHTVICLQHMMISRSDMPITYNDLTQWYAYHIQWSHTVLCLPHMISHSAMPTTYDLTQWHTYHTQWWSQWHTYNTQWSQWHTYHTQWWSQWHTYHTQWSQWHTYHTQWSQWHTYHTQWSQWHTYHTQWWSQWHTYHTQWSQWHTYHTQWWSRTAIQASHTLQWPALGGRLNEHDVHQLMSFPPEDTEVRHTSHLTEHSKVVSAKSTLHCSNLSTHLSHTKCAMSVTQYTIPLLPSLTDQMCNVCDTVYHMLP